jgi:thiosulfate/3-mercaptopyruvate sulfurtransferase
LFGDAVAAERGGDGNGVGVRDDDSLAPLYPLWRLAGQGRGVTANQDTIAYCRIGERSSLTWYVLKYLLGYPNVKNYDGSWTEWGNLIEAPIEK